MPSRFSLDRLFRVCRSRRRQEQLHFILAAGTNIIVGPAGSDDYKIELEKYLLVEITASAESRRKIRNLDFKKTVFVHESQLVRMSGWSVLFGFWTWLGLLVVLLVLNWQWTLILLLVTFVLFYRSHARSCSCCSFLYIGRRFACPGVDERTSPWRAS